MAGHGPRLDTARWKAVSPYLDRALDMEDEARVAWLTRLREDQPALAADLEHLLDERRAVLEEGFLESLDHPSSEPITIAGCTVGAYRLIAPIGQGGMGSVWLAERADGRFEGRAAVKLLNPSLMGASPSHGEERFKREGSLLARLNHANIARLIDAGVSRDGQPYLVLEYIDGQPIDAYCDEHALGVEPRIRLFLDVLSAVAHAHANLVVHRDLKPSNVLIAAGGSVKLLDFGIAKLLQSDEWIALTREGAAALTPEFAAPEQVTGSEVTTATDVYSLGVLLYLLLGGQHPVGSGFRSPADLVKAIVDTDPRRLSDAVADPKTETPATLTSNAARRATTPEKLQRLLRGDLDTIVAKALKKHAHERYASVTALADDLRRYLMHQPIGARPDTWMYRTTKFARRHVRGVLAGAGAVALVAMLIGFYTVRLTAERDRARIEAQKSTKVSELMTELLTGADPYRDRPDPTVRDLLDAGAARIAEGARRRAGDPRRHAHGHREGLPAARDSRQGPAAAGAGAGAWPARRRPRASEGGANAQRSRRPHAHERQRGGLGGDARGSARATPPAAGTETQGHRGDALGAWPIGTGPKGTASARRRSPERRSPCAASFSASTTARPPRA